ncbi:histidinol dehydrogenase [Lawsonibacter sp. JLR.KK007]|uniref:histidinol dehydrogenase n=1 Tax=Lawsonibacter sp. JLR.KK007 TaxID=3114293 RepID=UPI002FF42D22
MEYLKQAAPRPAGEAEARARSVAGIIQSIRDRGDEALIEYNTKFDGSSRTALRVTREEIDRACARMTRQELDDLRRAADHIRSFALAQKGCLTELSGFSTIPGAELGHRVIPVDSCGCYVPGGSYPLFSTALMLIIPARAAGVKRIAACAPAVKGTSSIHYKTLAAMDLAGADEIYTVGGAQAIAALAWGTEQIQPVDVIVGPGNQYVAEAKRQCFGQVGIDFFAGPSEVLAIADSSADPRILAADMLAQSEHDPMAKGILITTSRSLGEAVLQAAQEQLSALSTADIARASWDTFGEVILADSLDEAADLANQIAPEHLEVILQDESILPRLVNFGSLFIGQETGEVFGDYASGTNHTLPTVRAARYTGGVWVGTFLKVCTWQRCQSAAMREIAPLAARMAHGEGLEAHARAAELRLELL